MPVVDSAHSVHAADSRPDAPLIPVDDAAMVKEEHSVRPRAHTPCTRTPKKQVWGKENRTTRWTVGDTQAQGVRKAPGRGGGCRAARDRMAWVAATHKQKQEGKLGRLGLR